MASPSTRYFTYNSVNIIAILEAGVTSQSTKESVSKVIQLEIGKASIQTLQSGVRSQVVSN